MFGLIIGSIAFPATAKEKLTVLTAYPEDVVSRFETAFERAYQDIDLAVFHSKGDATGGSEEAAKYKKD